ncbi:MAG: ABC transporter substrate-binding protein [Methyloversatilis discipulorum]|uniref:ABC transporter substrate-binding protein n=1 Tax=Methyloversatilis discipulorum TaxID=1119528 RepID=UPI0026EA31DB|nr:ABC transporter substrate-binding protein [Methyloversatilis discipulorum]MBT9516020.1 ABC transporter substrate-binding protein [Methyloversatilis discipulorum]
MSLSPRLFGWALAVAFAFGGYLALRPSEEAGRPQVALEQQATVTAGTPEASTLTIATISTPFQGKQVYSGATQIVLEQGWLEAELAKRGVTLKIEPVSPAVGGPQINEGFAAKRIDFAAYGDFPALIAKAGGVDIRSVLSPGQGNNAYLVVRRGLDVKSIKDLKGRSIAIHRGRPWELTLAKLLDANGLTLNDFKVYNLNPQAGHAALASGKVDATFTLSEALVTEQQGAGTIIWSTKDAPLHWKMRTGLWARHDFTEQHPDITQLVVAAYVKAAHWQSQEANRDAVLQMASRGNLPVELIARDYDDPRLGWKDRFSPLLDGFYRQHFRDVAAYIHDNGLVQKHVPVEDIIDDRFLNAALKELSFEGYWSAQSEQQVAAK